MNKAPNPLLALYKGLIVLILLFVISEKSHAQSYATSVFTVNINEISLIRINPLSNINMYLLASIAGESPGPKINNSSYLQLTSISALNQTRRITASYTGTMPPGTYMTLSASTCTTGAGNRGTPSSTLTLSNTNQTLINNIGSGYTGTSTGYGYRLTYTWQIDPNNYNLLNAIQNVPIVINYTVINN